MENNKYFYLNLNFGLHVVLQGYGLAKLKNQKQKFELLLVCRCKTENDGKKLRKQIKTQEYVAEHVNKR